MTYQEAIEFLYQQLPVFHRSGAPAYKPGLGNVLKLCEKLGYPETKFSSVHIAGTNGKGSTSHSLAAILQCAGYKTGLYTSPHLKNFTERIRINGKEMPEAKVVEFLENHWQLAEEIQPSFFEWTVAMAFNYFAAENVDIAVVETGMGGRLDSTNILTPRVSVITNISYDHMQFLGDTLSKIAIEKAGIIKKGIPVVISEYQEEVADVFLDKANTENAPLFFASKEYHCEKTNSIFTRVFHQGKIILDRLQLSLKGSYQLKNLPGILKTVELLQNEKWNIQQENIRDGLEQVILLTGLKGRWQVLQQEPMVICDVGHNEAGIREAVEELKTIPHRNLHFILGFSKDKDIKKILNIYPSNGFYYFCSYSGERALKSDILEQEATNLGISGKKFDNVNLAFENVLKKAGKDDLIFIGGSIFLVAELEHDQL